MQMSEWAVNTFGVIIPIVIIIIVGAVPILVSMKLYSDAEPIVKVALITVCSASYTATIAGIGTTIQALLILQ